MKNFGLTIFVLSLALTAEAWQTSGQKDWEEILPAKYQHPNAAALKLALAGSYDEKTQEYKRRCEEKLGAVPKLKTDIIKSVPIHTYLNGKKVVPHPDAKGPPHYEDDQGKRTRVELKYLDKSGGLLVCDTPSLAIANGNDGCNFRAKQQLASLKASRAGVYWIAIIRGEGAGAPTGLIGWDSEKGAACFFSASFDSRQEKLFVDRPMGDNCLNCHTQSDPFVVTPHVRRAWRELEIPRQMKGFTLGEYRYHVPGIELADLEHRSHQLTVTGKDGAENKTCTRCHLVTATRGGGSSHTMLMDSIGHSPFSASYFADIVAQTGFKAAAWMPQGVVSTDAKKVEAARQMVEAITAFTSNKESPELRVTSSQTDCSRLSAAIGRVDAVKNVPGNGERILRWTLVDTQPPLKAAQIQFHVQMRTLQRYDYAPAGVPLANNRGWELRHRFPGTDVSTLVYSITPVLYQPDNPTCPIVVGGSRDFFFSVATGQEPPPFRPPDHGLIVR